MQVLNRGLPAQTILACISPPTHPYHTHPPSISLSPPLPEAICSMCFLLGSSTPSSVGVAELTALSLYVEGYIMIHVNAVAMRLTSTNLKNTVHRPRHMETIKAIQRFSGRLREQCGLGSRLSTYLKTCTISGVTQLEENGRQKYNVHIEG